MGLGEGAAAAAGAVDAVAALVAPHNFRAPHSDCDKPSRNDLYWPKPLTVSGLHSCCLYCQFVHWLL